MSEEEFRLLTSEKVQQYIFDHGHEDTSKLLLKHQTILGLPARLIAQQIATRKKNESKIPLWYQTKGIVYPPSLNLEQSSSEATAKFKTQLIVKNIGSQIKVADLTGGFGVDGFFISQMADSLELVEPNQDLIKIAQHNLSLLGSSNIGYHNFLAEDFLKTNSKKFDMVFIDPSRRDSNAKKVFSFSDCLPKVSLLFPQLFDVASYVLIKASPLLDIHQGLKELPGTKKVFVVSVANEVKELLFLLQKNFSLEPSIETYNLQPDGEIKHHFEFTFAEEQNCVSQFNSPQKYLYEPTASILKSGAFKLIGKRFDLEKIEVNTHLYTSNHFHNDFPGRVFEIKSLDLDVKSLAEKKANVITRNFPLSAEALKKKLKLWDGGGHYVIAFSGQGKKYVTLAKRVT